MTTGYAPRDACRQARGVFLGLLATCDAWAFLLGRIGNVLAARLSRKHEDAKGTKDHEEGDAVGEFPPEFNFFYCADG